MEKEILNIDWFDLAIICQDYTVNDITDDYDEVPNEELINDFELIHSETLQYDLEDSDYCDIEDLGNGEFSFITSFYNGGTYLTEMLQEELSK